MVFVIDKDNDKLLELVFESLDHKSNSATLAFPHLLDVLRADMERPFYQALAARTLTSIGQHAM